MLALTDNPVFTSSSLQKVPNGILSVTGETITVPYVLLCFPNTSAADNNVCLTVCSSKSDLIGNILSLGSGNISAAEVFSTVVVSLLDSYILYADFPVLLTHVVPSVESQYVPLPAA